MAGVAVTGPRERPAKRPEIQALRAAAVLAVVTNHLWPHTMTGGFVGVDVFFVISGYLIIGHLAGELDRTGGVRLAAFWARRARRLLPAALLVLLATLGAMVAVMPQAAWGAVIRQVAASALYMQNWQLAADSVDYFASQRASSPVTHFWSLSVEEQFYLVCPLLIFGVARAVHHRRESRRTAIVALLTLILVTSAGFALYYTGTHPNEAYFVTPSRAWEFVAGGLLAVLRPLGSRRAVAGGVLSWAGWAAILCAVFAFSEGVHVPGAPAVLPVVGTLLVVWAGPALPWWSPSSVTSARPVQFVGDVSYSLYLWHWPLIVFVPIAMGRPSGLVASVLVLVASLVLAWLTRHLVEEPVRRWRPLAEGRPRRTLALAAVATMVVAGTAAGCDWKLERDTNRLEAQLQAAVQGGSSCFGAGALADRTACAHHSPTNVVPAPAIAASDVGDAFSCYAQPYDSSFRTCTVVRPPEPAKRVALVGDSHAAMLSIPLKKIASVRHWRMDVYLRSACPLTDADVFYDPQFSDNCSHYRDELVRDLTSPGRYDLVIVTGWSGLNVDRLDLPHSQRLDRLTAGYRSAWARVEAAGPRVVAIADNPVVPGDYADCVNQHGSEAAARCLVPRSQALPDDPVRRAASALHMPLVDLTDLYCDQRDCPMIVGGVLVHFDPQHITATYAKTLPPYLDQRLQAAIA